MRQARRAPPPLLYQWARVRWDRIGRTALLIVLAVVAGLYVQHIVEFFVTRANAGTQHTLVRRLAQENAALRAQRAALQQPATIKRYARALGMVQSGERPYVVLGLPAH
jgi:cell division protein FtsB